MVFSAEELGRKVLGEVKEEGLSDLLKSLRASAENQSSTWSVNVPAFDNILECFKPLHVRNPRPVIEITSPQSCSGKTELVYAVIAATILPQREQDDDDGEANDGGAVVVFDTDCHFDVGRLATVMRMQLEQADEALQPQDAQQTVDTQMDEYEASNPSNDVAEEEEEEEEDNFVPQIEDVELEIRKALDHVHIIEPSTFEEFVAAINKLPEYLFNLKKHKSADHELDLIVLDSVSAFSRELRYDDDLVTVGDIDESRQPRITYVDLVSALRTAQKIFGCIVVATSACTSDTLDGRPGFPLPFKPVLPPVWNAYCTVRLAVIRDPVRPFAADMTIEEAEEEASARQEAVQLSSWSAWVDQLRGETWPEHVWTALDVLPQAGSFSFCSTGSGVKLKCSTGSEPSDGSNHADGDEEDFL